MAGVCTYLSTAHTHHNNPHPAGVGAADTRHTAVLATEEADDRDKPAVEAAAGDMPVHVHLVAAHMLGIELVLGRMAAVSRAEAHTRPKGTGTDRHL
jgi:hypothetical protein